jgi:signal transduction histidine kinase
MLDAADQRMAKATTGDLVDADFLRHYSNVRATNTARFTNLAAAVATAGDEQLLNLDSAHDRSFIYSMLAGTIVFVALMGLGMWRGGKLRRRLRLAHHRANGAELAAIQTADLVGLASHELRNPLAAMSLNAQLIEAVATDHGDAVLAQAGKEAFIAAQRTEALVAELLDLSRLDAGRLKLKIEPTPMLPAVESAVELARQHRGEHPVVLQGRPSSFVLADPERLGIIVRNLVDNAFKYSPTGQTVTIDVIPDEKDVALEVSDHGPGVPNGSRDLIFERFERLAQTEHVGGIGIGLHLSRQLARHMGGEVTVRESTDGARMCLVLPRPPSGGGA